MTMAARFASIPKCASRTLKAHGLLGEVEGRHHSRLTEYPDRQTYEWMVILRPAADWYASWWQEAQRTPDTFTQAMGFRFRSLEEDLKALESPPEGIAFPQMEGLHAWIPPDFSEDYPRFIQSGMGFMEYCYSVITCGIPCTPLHLADLDSWLSAQGLQPIHVNPRVV
jgi:hypothetical protein